jgi:hypothetical protein
LTTAISDGFRVVGKEDHAVDADQSKNISVYRN